MSESPLPLECLRIVLDILAFDHFDTTTLATLLRVNRFFAEATLPFLYVDPFLNDYHPRDGPFTGGPVLQARTLLRQVPAVNFTDLLKAFFFGKQDFDGENDPFSSMIESEQHQHYSPVLHYLPHIRKLNFRGYPISHPCSPDTHYTNDRLTAYLETSGLKEKYCAITGSEAYAHDEYLFSMALRQDIELQLTWALCVPESIQTLTIGLSDCQRYLDRVEQFKALSTLEFVFDEQYEFFDFATQELTVEGWTRRRELLERLKTRMETMVEFVKEHTHAHRCVLQLATFDQSYIRHEMNRATIEDYQMRMLQYLPPLHNPTFLDAENLCQFALRADDTNVEFVEQIDTGGAVGYTNEILDTLSPFLRRCRALKSIDIQLLDDDLFRWAVQEKREFDRQRSRGEDPTKPLVPVESARIQFVRPGYGPQFDSIVQGFGDSLKTLHLNGQFVVDPFHEPVQQTAVFGRQWNLAKLKCFTARTYMAPLALEPDALLRCPALEYLILEDCITDTQTTADILPWKPAVLPHLKFVDIKGSPARSFHPDTLHSAPEVETLNIVMEDSGGYYNIPPMQELQYLGLGSDDGTEQTGVESGVPARPRWTWDWHLPQLRQLSLSAEFALCFQFKLLRQTPSLGYFSLNISTAAGLHGRRITVDELLLDKDKNGGEDEYIDLPKLADVRLVGRWDVGAEFWKVFLGKVAPGIIHLEESECSGFTLEDWVDAASALENLDMAYSSLVVDDKSLLAQGLKPFEFGSDEYGLSPTPGAQFNFQGGHFRYVLPPKSSVEVESQ
ncbi:hypothetical protein BGX33_007749 [Mortierella sp. NVP41]|nr:hypothetical protein BGX33_007749 [Mortierella sp. NVP41]